jgi:competence protein ComEC
MILTDFTVKNVIMPDITSNSQAFAAMLDAMEKSQANVIEAVAGETFTLGDLTLKILAPLKKYSDTNDMSVVIRATYGSVSMMFTGDAEGNMEGKSEKDILATYKASELDCDFLKVGHHGSDTSTSPAFLAAVSPKIAAISCGAGNKHGHPVQSVLDTLNAAGVTVYRTDLSGTLVFVCDGKTIEYKK